MPCYENKNVSILSIISVRFPSSDDDDGGGEQESEKIFFLHYNEPLLSISEHHICNQKSIRGEDWLFLYIVVKDYI